MSGPKIEWHYSTITLTWRGAPGGYHVSRQSCPNGGCKYILWRERKDCFRSLWLGDAMSLSEVQGIAERHAKFVRDFAKESA